MNNKLIKIIIMVITLVAIIFITVLHFALKYTPEKKLNDISDKIIKEENKISPEQQTSLEKIKREIEIYHNK